jgi:hypothetical protein
MGAGGGDPSASAPAATRRASGRAEQSGAPRSRPLSHRLARHGKEEKQRRKWKRWPTVGVHMVARQGGG